MTKNSIKLLQNWLNNYDTIILHRHVRPDPDALGSQLGFKALLQKMYPNKKILATGETVDNLAFIGSMDEVQDSDYQNALVIVLDTANAARIDDARYHLGDKLVKIDHHPPVENYGDINIVDTTVSSTSELIAELLMQFGFGQDYLNTEIAERLYIGIVGDTGRFLFNNTSPRTMEIAGMLLSYDFDHTKMLNQMSQRTLESMHFQGYVLQHFSYEDHVGFIFITEDILQQFKISANDASLFVNSISDVAGIEAWVFAVDEGNQIRARIRSKRAPINTLAARYNGGGHPMASGATVYSKEELEQLISELKSTVKE
ncbi:bifunctional oligoribonuclease/PAP phosphatase NrnA [Macrococcus brunensis]|uniref:Bifunctional oligoribonuclease/PAP phosphatase NrnA n=1 Tax=Macrococcus brunensis TaxID=198483 RepID=A0A4R6BFF8_9STAP|nr:bifunctional oligoribonuclease/PAP phosphatase NrnA [Macrococcus brunensis]TDL98575.1 bifunctional oligoribonuclease/PAP phosphatase NrnA [Macrococcus brunensis]ULG71311.1 bifunctional oligoribonuclease/PAP phosphatase NrnA [Macrococcus brunensis]